MHQESVWKVSVYSAKGDYLPCVTWEKLCWTGDFLVAVIQTGGVSSKPKCYSLGLVGKSDVSSRNSQINYQRLKLPVALTRLARFSFS